MKYSSTWPSSRPPRRIIFDARDLTSRTFGGGSLGVLFQNELHDWRIGGQSNPFFARLGIIFGKQRIAFDFTTKVTELAPGTGDKPATVQPLKQKRQKPSV